MNDVPYMQIFEDQRALLEGLPDDVLGSLLKAMLAYNFDSRNTIEMNPIAGYVFPAVRTQLDKNLDALENKRAGGKARA